jgi:site-specific DNA recombinase
MAVVALYARVSTTKQAEKDLSIPDQLRSMRRWCEANGHAVAVEYIDPGESATDDRRPAFQQMIEEATRSPPPFAAIVVHSWSRFFRDAYQCEFYRRKLEKAGASVISVTQPTSDDPSGAMMRQILNVVDEHQSKENAKHTLRSMIENARQGYFNGSKPPFGYQTIETTAAGNKGQKKKRLAIDRAEAAIVQKIFTLYLYGHVGTEMGAKNIAVHLNGRGITLRGQRWTRSRVHGILASNTYIGNYQFNRHDRRAKKAKPETEWVSIRVEPIVEAETFARAAARRRARAPSKIPPRVVNSPTLLTGLLKCGSCGAGMTLATGKGGRYRYYKCNTRIGKGTDLCAGRTISMEMLDGIVLRNLTDRICVPGRIKSMLTELQRSLKLNRTSESLRCRDLTRELEALKTGSERLYEAVEKGVLPLDASLQERARKLQTRRQEILIEIGNLRQRESLPAAGLKPGYIDAFAQVLRTRLLGDKHLAKQYLRLLVTAIRLTGQELKITGSYAALAQAVAQTKTGTHDAVPTFDPKWLPDQGSNLGPAD